VIFQASDSHKACYMVSTHPTSAVEALLFFFQHSFSDLELSSLQILLLLHLVRKEEDEIISQFVVLKKAEIMTFARPIERLIP